MPFVRRYTRSLVVAAPVARPCSNDYRRYFRGRKSSLRPPKVKDAGALSQPSMPQREVLEALLIKHLPAVERIIATVCRRHALRPEMGEDFASWAKLKLVENDYAILQKFRGESSITTYLTVVVAMLFRDYRVHHWGRWRPSAAAQRLGALAVRLETLVYRDRMPLSGAAELLRTEGETKVSDRKLAELLAQLPERGPLRPREVGPEPLAVHESASSADELVRGAELDAEVGSAHAALRCALDHQPPEDALIVRMHYWDGMGVAEIARVLGLPQKPLYRRIERVLTRLREELEAAGLSRERILALVGERARDAVPAGENDERRPSNEMPTSNSRELIK